MKFEFEFEGIDGYKINSYKWIVKNPKACIQIIHGKGETAERYEEFIEVLNNNGYSVYANDHRGHGKTIKKHEVPGEVGKEGFHLMIEDEYTLTQIIKSENPNKKLFIFGHSLGSFILQEYLIRYGSNVDKVIISGSCGKMGVEILFGKIIAFIEMHLRKKNKGSKTIEFLNFGLYNFHFKKDKYGSSWLHRINENTNFNNHKFLCNKSFPAHFYYYLYSGIRKLHHKNRVAMVPKKLEIFIFSGEKDPVGKMGRGVKKLYSMYSNLGINKVELKLYKDARHEMLNEINRKEVFEDVLNFINS